MSYIRSIPLMTRTKSRTIGEMEKKITVMNAKIIKTARRIDET
jgi:hypothetical protein